ncbi:MAG: ATP-binding cassette, subfamily bacterial [Solirubrobacteraceae bacterium]|nr:ATP-binding cassette, subfamily bacterial [Solirubrobacteraceae bacterium]
MSGPAPSLIRPLIRRHWAALGSGGAGAVVVTLAQLAQPFPLQWVIDRVIQERGDGFALDPTALQTLWLAGLAVIIIAAVGAIATYFAEFGLSRAGERVAHELRVATYAHLQRLSLAFHDRRQKGDLVTRLTEDANQVGDLFSESIGTIAQAVLILVGMAIVTVLLDPFLAAAMFAVTPVLAIVTVHYRRKVKVAARSQRAREGEIASMAGETLSAMRVVKAFGREDYEQGRVLDRSEERRQFGVVAAGLEARFGGAVEVIGATTMAVVLVLGAYRVAAGAISPGALVVFAQYSRKVYSPLKDIAKQSSRIAKRMARAERIAEVLAADLTLEDRPDAITGGRAQGRIVLHRASFSYDAARPVLDGVSLCIEPGEHVALVGASGAGKSTIGALIARFYDPLSGRVEIDGRDARDWSLSWVRGQIGLLLQDTVLFTGTVADNIAYGTSASRQEVVAAATAAGAHDFILGLPGGYDEPLGPQGVGLSGGQRQRLGIARVLLRNPPILVLDEPTTGLDALSEASLMGGLSGLMRGRTTVIVTHAMSLASTADRVLVVEAGRIVQAGSPQALLAQPGPFRRMALEQAIDRQTPEATSTRAGGATGAALHATPFAG